MMKINSERRPTNLDSYLPTLDGWRAIAVLSVIAYHAKEYRLGRLSDQWLHTQGFLGVDLFFAISGLLICSRLLAEEERSEHIALGAFYVRRSFRIVPPMLVYLVTIALLGLRHVIHVGRTAWLSSLLFFNNYYGAYRRDVDWSIYTNHFWSLSVEEHFYLIFPFILVLIPKLRFRLLGFLTGIFFVWSLVHIAITRHDPLRAYYGGRTDLRISELFFPALLAVLLRQAGVRTRLTRFTRPHVALPVMIFLIIAGLSISPTFTYAVIVPVAFPFIILSTLLHPLTLIGRVLEWSPFKSIGRISYSIYLWQQLFFSETPAHVAGLLGYLQGSPWRLGVTLLIATTSYFVVEKPFIRLGQRYAALATARKVHNYQLEPLANSTLVDRSYNRIE